MNETRWRLLMQLQQQQSRSLEETKAKKQFPSLILRYFDYSRLPPKLQVVSKPIGDLAHQIDNDIPDGAEKSAGFRKLLEAKDCFVRAALAMLMLALLLCWASSADACQKCGLFGNRCAFRQVQAVHVQQVVAPLVYPQVNYFVGAPIRVEAIVQQALRQDPAGYAEYQKFRAWQAGQAQQQVKPEAPMPSLPVEPQPATQFATLTARCAQCHSGDTPKKGLLLDGTAKLTCEQMARAMKRVQDGSMPPKGTLTGEERGDVFQELLDLVETKP